MKYTLIPLGQLSSNVYYSTAVINENWLPDTIVAEVLIDTEIVRIEIFEDNAILVKRGAYNTTIKDHIVGAVVYLLEVEQPISFVSGINISLSYPFDIEDSTDSNISIGGIDYLENIYTYGSLVSRSYPVEGNLEDTTNANISINIAAWQAPFVNEDLIKTSYAVSNAELINVVKRGYNEDESVSIGYSITNAELINTVKSLTNYSDGSGAHAVITSGSLIKTAIDTTGYTDGSGVHAVIVSGSLS